MPQEFRVLRCYKCDTFQVHLVKKSNKWECKICGDKQSLKQVYGTGTGNECRQHVQKLNRLRMLKEQGFSNTETNYDTFSSITHNDNSVLEDQEDIFRDNQYFNCSSNFGFIQNNGQQFDTGPNNLSDNVMSNLPPKEETHAINKWHKYLEKDQSLETNSSYNDDLFNGVKCVLELPSNKKKKRNNISYSSSCVKKFKAKIDAQEDSIESENDVIERTFENDNGEYWDSATKVNECWEEIDYNETNNVPVMNVDTNPLPTNKWSKYMDSTCEVQNVHPHRSSLHHGDTVSTSSRFSSTQYYDNQNTSQKLESNNKVDASKRMKYIDPSTEDIPIQTSNITFVNNITNSNKCNNLNIDTKNSKWSKYLDVSDIDNNSTKNNQNHHNGRFKDANNITSQTINKLNKTIASSFNNNCPTLTKDSRECKELNELKLDNSTEKRRLLPTASISNIKSALSKFEVVKENLKTMQSKSTGNVNHSKDPILENDGKKFTFDSFNNNDDMDLENIFNV